MSDSNDSMNAFERWVQALGYAGLIPFIAAALGIYITDGEKEQFVLQLFFYYSVVIATFLCGTFWVWGIEQKRIRFIVASNALTLVIWVSAYFGISAYTLVVNAIVFLLLKVMEKENTGDVPSFYENLREQLTLVVLVCHVIIILYLGF